MRKMGKVVNGLLTALLLCSISATDAPLLTNSFQISIDSLANNKFPQLDAYLSVLDVQGFPITGLGKDNFVVSEDGLAISDFNISEYSNSDEALAIVLAIDTSGSMDSSKSPSPMENAVEAAKDFVSKLGPQDFVAVVTFSDEVKILSELSNDKSRISSDLDGLEPGGATAINDAIVESINILKIDPSEEQLSSLPMVSPMGIRFTHSIRHLLMHQILKSQFIPLALELSMKISSSD